MERRLYLIPGVATDRSVFAALELPQYEKVYLDWIQPAGNESIRSYAERMVASLKGVEAPILIGYSFGGIVAQEMAKLIPDATVILISSIKSYKERPLGMWLTSSFGLHRIIPSEIGKEFRFAYTWMNDPQNAMEREFIHAMRKQLNHHHTDWAIDQAVNWRHDDHTPRLYHIHGDQDRIFPIRYIRNCIPVRGGTHLMVLNKGAEISRHIDRIVRALPGERRRMPA
jgi:pimeloyl-ACP methyl ester carboxylesterase